MVTFEEKVNGVLFGTAYGDALGATIEKLTFDQIKEQYGEVDDIRNDWYKANYSSKDRLNRMRGHGIITDDTLMTIALVETYLEEERHLDSWDIGNEFVRNIVYKKRYIPEFGKEGIIQDRLFYPEKYIYQRHVLANCDPREGGYGNMINCGAAMYIAPVGVVNAGNPSRAYDEAIAFASGHQASYGLEAAGVLAASVAEAFKKGASINSVVDTAIKVAKDGTKGAIKAIVSVAEELRESSMFDDKAVVSAFYKALKPFSPMEDDIDRSEDKLGIASNHYTPSRLFSIEELPIALGYLVLYSGDFKKSVVKGVNSGRDTDSIGVMISVICGALYGDQIFENNDKKLLEEVNKLEIQKNSMKFAEVAQKIIKNDMLILKEQESILN